MTIIIRDFVDGDLDDGYWFYERQSPGLGQYFADCIFADIESLELYVGSHPRRGRYFQATSKRFPYAIYYTFKNDVIEVWAVVDQRRDPSWISQQLKHRN